ncbi:MAG: hypothetical protein ACTSVZ_02635 [Promethearchaeota archaeon]
MNPLTADQNSNPETIPLPIPESKQKVKAIALISGGLDSAIATKMVIDQGIEVTALNFHSLFCTCAKSNSKHNQCGAFYFAQKLQIPMRSIVKGDDYLELIQHPQFGYGKNMNPCIDCRIHILEKTKEIMQEIGAEFIVTGEVLGQRPKSQMLHALLTIEKNAGLEKKILRPLSAKLLPPTIMEKTGIIDREKLLDIHGRRRNIQVELGRNYNLIQQYCAGGGCLLTDKNFSNKLRDYLAHSPNPTMSEMKFLKIGRHFRFDKLKIISGRDESENLKLIAWAGENDVILNVKDVMGPATLIFHPLSQDDLQFAAQLTLRYSDSATDHNEIVVKSDQNQFKNFSVHRDPEIEELKMKYRI